MTSETTSTVDRRPLSEELAGAFDWWREAGVDYDFAGEAIDRLAEAASERENQEQARAAPAIEQLAPQPPVARPFAPQGSRQVATIGDDRASWPRTLEAFREWWMSEPSLDIARAGLRVPPRGEPGADLMILVGEPEAGDHDTLLSGIQGKLLAGFLRAAGVAYEKCYFASMLPHPAQLPDWDALKAAGLGELALHHMTLAAPKRVLAFGRNILPLLGHDQAQGAAQMTLSQGITGQVAVIGAPGLEELLRSAPRRKKLWQDWLDWTA